MIRNHRVFTWQAFQWFFNLCYWIACTHLSCCVIAFLLFLGWCNYAKFLNCLCSKMWSWNASQMKKWAKAKKDRHFVATCKCGGTCKKIDKSIISWGALLRLVAVSRTFCVVSFFLSSTNVSRVLCLSLFPYVAVWRRSKNEIFVSRTQKQKMRGDFFYGSLFLCSFCCRGNKHMRLFLSVWHSRCTGRPDEVRD